ncbi:MAG TPA: MBL fold metallo-hydrolase [Clostridia bacterium]|nr:MBL fold metallo-hydrolase [Clostridia bacterium]
MKDDVARIYYLYHSGFAVKYRDNLLIFDYYSDESESGLRGLKAGTISRKDLRDADKVFVFVSHSHEDHYNPVIYDWKEINEDIHYFLSFEVDAPTRNLRYHNMHPYEEYNSDTISVRTYGSTDLGVSFVASIDGLNIFHAGDLNCWYWYYESTPQELEEDEASFLREVDRIGDVSVDIAFFPVDPRLREYYYMGGEYFIKRLKPKVFIPMHFGTEYEITKAFAQKVKSLDTTRVVELSHRGQEIIF